MAGRSSEGTPAHPAPFNAEQQEPETARPELLAQWQATDLFVLRRSAARYSARHPADQPETPVSRAVVDHAAWIERVRAFRQSVQRFNEVVHQQRRRRPGPTLLATSARPLPAYPEPDPAPTSPGPTAAASPADGGSLPLTARQREVAGLIAAGKSNAVIAEELVLSPGTVANHVEHILNRLNFRNRAQIAAWAVQQGLLAQTAPEHNGHSADRD
jgi:DNA-binding CsgD family transcriptional regulator